MMKDATSYTYVNRELNIQPKIVDSDDELGTLDISYYFR